jgi:hypothetical protein
MSYIGNQPAESYASFEKQVFTIVNSQTAYTLTHAVTNENDIRLVVNNVVQEPGSGKAYTAANTTLTLSAALVNGTDEMYCVYLGRALQTVNPPAASVGNSQTAPTIITGQTAETSIATDDTILIHDTSASALRKMTRANFVSGVGGTNTPAFALHKTSEQTVSSGSVTTVTWDASSIDTDSGVDLSNNKYVVPSGKGGTYFLNYHLGTDYGSRWIIGIKINGTVKIESDKTLDNSGIYGMYTVSGIISLSAGDEITATYYATNGSGNNIRHENTSTAKLTRLEGYKLL